MTNRLKLNSAAAVGTGTMISVMSGKGGVGKSVIAFNLAERLVAFGKSVLLVDADNSAGNIHILANLAVNLGVREFVAGEQTLSETARPLTPNLDILAMSSAGPIDGGLTPTTASNLVAALRAYAVQYDYIVLDHGSGVSDAAVVLAAASDINLLVVVPELTSISDAYGLCKHLHTHHKSADCRLLVNRAESDEESEYVRTRFSAVAEQFLGWIPGFSASLPEDKVVRRALAVQQPVALVDPEAPLVQALTTLAESLPQSPPRSADRYATETINITRHQPI